MYRPSKYKLSQDSLVNFANVFNSCEYCPSLRCYYNKVETYDNDGYFLDTVTIKVIGFDWEIRDKYFTNGVFAFPTLGQYERKIRKPSIDISVQGDSTQTAVMVAWHDDFKVEKQKQIVCSTDYDIKENSTIRYTDKFKIYSYVDIKELKFMLAWALDNNVFCSKAFNWRDYTNES